ncbi:hypothetical protein INS49_011536 [Diaporthe citri]|uniref:uncharacterized protein n=1 Tax=Diaporthe citri TaxID=83186 RepID=UPI001C7F4CDD|nr:uncharacterized protein INS49_011536 [Diaporthe citri]KAG6360474.1 hypothetical protein INS49_011536 [Diaporthe citri]
MAQPTQSNTWIEERSRQEGRERAADLLLEDMQRFLPAVMDPTTLSAVKDSTVTKYGQTENYDKLVVRHEAIKAHIRHVEERLYHNSIRGYNIRQSRASSLMTPRRLIDTLEPNGFAVKTNPGKP